MEAIALFMVFLIYLQCFLPVDILIALCIFLVLFAFSFLAACESTKTVSSKTKVSPSNQEFRDQVAEYCKVKAQKERINFVKREKALHKPERDLGVRARQVFNKTFEKCLRGHNVPKSN